MRAPAALALVLLPGCAGLVAQSAWGFSDPAAFPGFTHTFSSWNLTEISRNHSKYGIQALYPLSWTAPRSSPCPTPIKRYGGTTGTVQGCVTIRPHPTPTTHPTPARHHGTDSQCRRPDTRCC